MGTGAGKGRGDDSSSSSDEVDGKIKVLYMIILLLLGLLATFVTAVIVLVWAKEQSGKTTDIGQIFPPTAGTNTLGQPALAEFDDPQIISVKHPNFPDSVVIYCTSGIGLPNAEVPCESSTILYNDASRFKMDKNGAYACIFCKDQELCSNILEQNYAINCASPAPRHVPAASFAPGPRRSHVPGCSCGGGAQPNHRPLSRLRTRRARSLRR
jgi:hypothetical protein